jgi:hypothetical protein
VLLLPVVAVVVAAVIVVAVIVVALVVVAVIVVVRRPVLPLRLIVAVLWAPVLSAELL